MSVPHIILDNLPSLCQKLSDLVEVWRSYNKNNFACFLRHGVVHFNTESTVLQSMISKMKGVNVRQLKEGMKASTDASCFTRLHSPQTLSHASIMCRLCITANAFY